MKLKKLTTAIIASAMTFTLAVTASAATTTVTYNDEETCQKLASHMTSPSTFTLTNVVSQSTTLFDSATVDRFLSPEDSMRDYLNNLSDKEIPVFNCVSSVDITYTDGKFQTGNKLMDDYYGLFFKGIRLELNSSLSDENVASKNKYWNYNDLYGYIMGMTSSKENPKTSDSADEGKYHMLAFGTTTTLTGTGSFLYMYQPMTMSASPMPCLAFIVNLYDSEEAATKTTEKVTTPKLSAPTVKSTVSGDKVKLTWNKVENAEAYRVYLYNTETGKYVKQATVSGTQKTFKNMSKGTYKYKVVAVTKNDSGKYINHTASKTCTAKVK